MEFLYSRYSVQAPRDGCTRKKYSRQAVQEVRALNESFSTGHRSAVRQHGHYAVRPARTALNRAARPPLFETRYRYHIHVYTPLLLPRGNTRTHTRVTYYLRPSCMYIQTADTYMQYIYRCTAANLTGTLLSLQLVLLRYVRIPRYMFYNRMYTWKGEHHRRSTPTTVYTAAQPDDARSRMFSR